MNKDYKEFNSFIVDITNNEKFKELRKQPHHGITRYEHLMRTTFYTYKVCKFFHKKNIRDVVRATLLHDFYTDDELTGNGAQRLGSHPLVALANATKYFELNDMQKDIIKSHMFPCNLIVPKYKESWLVTTMDKVVSTYEMLRFKLPLKCKTYFGHLFKKLSVEE
jgi:uncharacterized protein